MFVPIHTDDDPVVVEEEEALAGSQGQQQLTQRRGLELEEPTTYNTSKI